MRSMRFSTLQQLTELLIMLAQIFDLFFAQVLDVDQSIARAFQRRDDFIELQLNGERFFVLRSLNQKDHQEGHDRGAGANHKLPRVGVMEDRTGCGPADYNAQSNDE